MFLRLYIYVAESDTFLWKCVEWKTLVNVIMRSVKITFNITFVAIVDNGLGVPSWNIFV